MASFDEAKKLSQNMVNNPNETQPQEQPPEQTEQQPQEQTEQPPAQQPTSQPTQNVDPASLAELAAQTALQKQQEAEQQRQQMLELQKQNEELQKQNEELSKKNEEQITDQATEAPMIDFDSLAFLDDEGKQEAMKQYSDNMTEYTRNNIKKEFEPYMDYIKSAQEREEADSIYEELERNPEFKGISADRPRLEKIIKQNKIFDKNMPVDEKIITAYAIAKGADSLNKDIDKKGMTTEELMNMYKSNPEFQNAIEQERVTKLNSANSQQVPPMSASSGAGNAALNIPNKPKDWNDAKRMSKEMLNG